jgi:hypothetical protein
LCRFIAVHRDLHIWKILWLPPAMYSWWKHDIRCSSIRRIMYQWSSYGCCSCFLTCNQWRLHVWKILL